jgi:nitronate monooxygenase
VNLDLPIIQAPIGSASTPALVSAVSNAGGLGMLSGTWRTPDELRKLIQQTKILTKKSFGVNLVLSWDMTERLDICLSERVDFLSFFWGEPPSEFIRKCHKADAQVFHTVGSAREARIAVNLGVDFIVAQGVEAGGHVWGGVGTMALVPAVVDAVPKTPVVAAGGIADVRGVRAALALGAQAAWCGTRFLLAEEAAVHPRYREKLIQASETDTRHTTCFSGGWPDAPHRALVNETLLAWERGERWSDIIARYPDGEPIERYSSNLPGPGVAGEIDEMCLYAGQSVGLLKKVQPATQIVAELSPGAVE